MNKKTAMVLIMALCLILSSCGQAEPPEVKGLYMELPLSFGMCRGTYSGQVNDELLPEGAGIFNSADEVKGDWYYDGQWKQGHFEGEGSLVWVGGSVFTGEFSQDYLNGQGRETNAEGIVVAEGEYLKGELIRGILRDNMGNSYFEGELAEGFLIETKEEKAQRISKYSSNYANFSCKGCLEGSQKAGEKVSYTGVVDYVWPLESEDSCFDEFSLKCPDGTGWVLIMEYHMSQGTSRVKIGDTLTVYGVVVYTTTEDGGKLFDAPVIYAIGVEK